jgi:hypothetical protein
MPELPTLPDVSNMNMTFNDTDADYTTEEPLWVNGKPALGKARYHPRQYGRSSKDHVTNVTRLSSTPA